MPSIQKITPCLWFDHQGEEAAQFYTSIFRNSRIVRMSRYGEAGYEVHRKPAGTVMTVAFELDGQAFTALNGGPLFKFNEAISLQVHCETQEEVDYYWERLAVGGDEQAQRCGWLKDKYGASWQVVPTILIEMLSDPDAEKSQRAMQAMLQMKKIDIDKLKQAYAGEHLACQKDILHISMEGVKNGKAVVELNRLSPATTRLYDRRQSCPEGTSGSSTRASSSSVSS
jgi:predicted 3-demethylubiquinone-9 3-methyltransferase (glyoxalase superfamily)